MCLLVKEHARAVDEEYRTYDFDEWKDLSQTMEGDPKGFINTVNFKIAVPEVIQLTKYDELPQQEVKFTRKNIFKLYNHKCCYCGNRFKIDELTWDHVLPRSKGGKTNWKNIVAACYSCNSKKDNRTPKEAKMKMHYRPEKPKWRPSYMIKIDTGIKIRKSWPRFIDKMYWNVELEQD